MLFKLTLYFTADVARGKGLYRVDFARQIFDLVFLKSSYKVYFHSVFFYQVVMRQQLLNTIFSNKVDTAFMRCEIYFFRSAVFYRGEYSRTGIYRIPLFISLTAPRMALFSSSFIL